MGEKMKRYFKVTAAAIIASLALPMASAQEGCDGIVLESYTPEASATSSGKASNNYPTPKDVAAEVELLNLIKSQATRTAELANFEEMEKFCQSFHPIEHIRSNCEAVSVGDVISGSVWSHRNVNDEPECSTSITQSEYPGRVEVSADCSLTTSSICRIQKVVRIGEEKEKEETEHSALSHTNDWSADREAADTIAENEQITAISDEYSEADDESQLSCTEQQKGTGQANSFGWAGTNKGVGAFFARCNISGREFKNFIAKLYLEDTNVSPPGGSFVSIIQDKLGGQCAHDSRYKVVDESIRSFDLNEDYQRVKDESWMDQTPEFDPANMTESDFVKYLSYRETAGYEHFSKKYPSHRHIVPLGIFRFSASKETWETVVAYNEDGLGLEKIDLLAPNIDQNDNHHCSPKPE